MHVRYRPASAVRLRLLGAALLAVLAGAPPALADAIDGHWCDSNGRRLSIAGPDITTPGGKQTRGQYSRHAFSYAVPEGEQGAGETMSMTLLNEDTVRSSQGEPPENDIWHRCQDISRTPPDAPTPAS